MSARVVRTTTEEETIALGEEIGQRLTRPAVVLLIGKLGAGKTTIVKGIVKGLGAAASEDVTSPTFTLIHEYGEKSKVYHIDLYRLDRASQVLALGLDELMDRDAVLLVEWGERFPTLWPPNRIEIQMEWADETARLITVTGPLPSFSL
jgi:tRNA threonylcarbamoyladenosine biosynthesis protein TsaE